MTRTFGQQRIDDTKRDDTNVAFEHNNEKKLVIDTVQTRHLVIDIKLDQSECNLYC